MEKKVFSGRSWAGDAKVLFSSPSPSIFSKKLKLFGSRHLYLKVFFFTSSFFSPEDLSSREKNSPFYFFLIEQSVVQKENIWKKFQATEKL